MAGSSNAFVERLLGHRGALQAFFYRRLRTKTDAADLVQEVYLRMLRVSDTDSILNPEAYLFTVARNLLAENAIVDRRQAEAVEVAPEGGTESLPDVPEFDTAPDVAREVARLRDVLRQLSPECGAAVMLKYHHELSYQEIAERLEVSPSMVNKYLRQALSHCRRRMARLR